MQGAVRNIDGQLNKQEGPGEFPTNDFRKIAFSSYRFTQYYFCFQKFPCLAGLLKIKNVPTEPCIIIQFDWSIYLQYSNGIVQ